MPISVIPVLVSSLMYVLYLKFGTTWRLKLFQVRYRILSERVYDMNYRKYCPWFLASCCRIEEDHRTNYELEEYMLNPLQCIHEFKAQVSKTEIMTFMQGQGTCLFNESRNSCRTERRAAQLGRIETLITTKITWFTSSIDPVASEIISNSEAIINSNIAIVWVAHWLSVN